MGDVSGAAKVLRYVAFTLMTLFGVLGGLFVAGYAFEDLSTWVAVASTAAWAAPMVALSVVAVRFPTRAAPWLAGLTGAVAVLTLLDAAFQLVDRDALGPAVGITVFALAVSLGFLGLRRSTLAGALLLVLGVAQLAATAIGFVSEWAEGGGPSLADMLTTSSGVIVVPMLVVGLLFLLAGGLSHDSLRRASAAGAATEALDDTRGPGGPLGQESRL
jgi:hypothetical protein